MLTPSLLVIHRTTRVILHVAVRRACGEERVCERQSWYVHAAALCAGQSGRWCCIAVTQFANSCQLLRLITVATQRQRATNGVYRSAHSAQPAHRPPVVQCSPQVCSAGILLLLTRRVRGIAEQRRTVVGCARTVAIRCTATASLVGRQGGQCGVHSARGKCDYRSPNCHQLPHPLSALSLHGGPPPA